MSFIKTIIILLAFVVLGGLVAVAALTGMVPVLSDAFGTSQPMDLGVRYTAADYASGLAKVPGHSVGDARDLCINCPMYSQGSVMVSAAFTDAEITAQLNTLGNNSGDYRDVQVRFNADGTLETTGRIADPRFTAPVYAKGRIIVLPGIRPVFEVDKLVVGRLVMRPEDNIAAQGVLNAMAARFFSQNQGAVIGKLDVTAGQIAFKGAWPETMAGIPGATPYPLG